MIPLESFFCTGAGVPLSCLSGASTGTGAILPAQDFLECGYDLMCILKVLSRDG